MRARLTGHGPRYLSVALFCAALHNAMMIALDWAGVMYVASMVISMIVLLPIGFGLQASFTFAAQRSWPAFLRYTSVMLANLPITFVSVGLLYDVAGFPMFVAAPLSTMVLVLWNFLGSVWALRPPRGEATAAAAPAE